MPPRNVEQAPCSVDDELTADTIDQHPLLPEVVKRPPMQIVWRNVIWFIFLHGFAVYGLYLLPFARPATWLWGMTQLFFVSLFMYRILPSIIFVITNRNWL